MTTAQIHYRYSSWQAQYPGRAIDLTAVDVQPPGDFRGSAERALRLLSLGRRPKAALVAEILEDLEDSLSSVEDLESSYAAVLYPDPKRAADMFWIEFTTYVDPEDRMTPDQLIADEIISGDGEVIVEGPAPVDLPNGPGVRLFQTAVTRSEDGTQVHYFPRMTVCGTIGTGGGLYLVRSCASTGTLANALDELVTEWVAALTFPAGGGPS